MNALLLRVWSMTLMSLNERNNLKGESHNLQPISKTEMEYLISKGALKQNKLGSYKEVTGDKKMVVTGKYGNARGKQRFVPDPLFIRLLELKEKDKKEFDINKVKDNQKYLFSSERVS